MDSVQARLIAFFDIDGVPHAIHQATDGGAIFINASDGSLLALTHDEMARMIDVGRLRRILR